MKWKLALMGWALLLVAVAVLVPLRATGPIPNAQRFVLFALDEGQEAAFRLTGEEASVRLLAWLETPRPDSVDEVRRWTYALDLSLQTGAGEKLRWQHHTRSRLTLLEDDKPALTGPRPATVVTDSRIIDLQPQHLLDRGGLLTVRPYELREGERVLLRVLREIRREAIETTAQGSEQLRERLARIYPLPWPALQDGELAWFTTTRRRSLPADRLTGTTVPLLVRSPPSRTPIPEDEGTVLYAGQATALNLWGPTSVTLSTRWLDPTLGTAMRRPALEATLIDASPSPVRGGTVSNTRIEVPAGALWSVRLAAPEGQPPIILGMELEQDAAGGPWGEPPGLDFREPYGPEIRTQTWFRVLPEEEAVIVPVEAGGAWDAIRVEARPLTALGEDPVESVQVSWTSLDETGHVVAEGQWEVPWIYTPYERLRDEPRQRVSEETIRFLFHPEQVRTIAFQADHPIDLRFLAPIDVSPLRAPAYQVGEDFVGRYAPWELAEYIGIAPANLERLLLDERAIPLQVCVRIEPRGEGEGEGDDSVQISTRTVTPLGSRPRHPVVEPLREPGAWEDHHRTRLGDTQRLALGAEGRLEIDYRIDRSAVGEWLELDCGGTTAARARLVASAGQAVLTGLPEGEHFCRLDAPRGLYLAATPGQGQRWGRRTTWRADTTTLRIRADRQGELDRLFVRTYTPVGSPAPTILARIDEGEVVRLATVTERRTPAERTFTPALSVSTARLVNGGSLTAWQGMRVKLGDDLAPGEHLVDFEVRSADGAPVYARFDATWYEARRSQQSHWTERDP